MVITFVLDITLKRTKLQVVAAHLFQWQYYMMKSNVGLFTLRHSPSTLQL